MEHEASAIARKIQNLIVVENSHEDENAEGSQAGIFKNLLLVTLMGAAVVMTQLTLILVKWTKRLEG